MHGALKSKLFSDAPLSRQTEMPLKVVLSVQFQRQAAEVRRIDCSKLSDPRPRNSCRRVDCLFPNSEDVGVSGAKLWASGVRDQLAVVDQVRWCLTSQRLVDESGQLVVDPLLHREPVQATKNW